MRMPKSRVANRIRLFLLRNPLMSIVHLAQRTTMQKMQTRSKQKRPRWSVKDRTSLITFLLKEGAAKIADLISLLFRTTMPSRSLVTDYLQRKEIQLCQT